LVDGTKIEGQLAVAFEMPDYLVVYSPRLATVRSFLKKHVHALTVGGKREQINPKRALTAEDRKLLGRVEWPCEPPAKGYRPAYTLQKWGPPKRLLVWKNPGKSGVWTEPANWLDNGRPMAKAPESDGTGGKINRYFDVETDFLLPPSAKRYSARYTSNFNGDMYARHVTCEHNASLGARRVLGCVGNVWVSAKGGFGASSYLNFTGASHTFLINGTLRPAGEPVDLKTIAADKLARKWVLRKSDKDASMEVIGSAGSGDETHSQRGRLILSEQSTILYGNRCVFNVLAGATLELHLGSAFLMQANSTYRPDMLVRGKLFAGRPDRPLTSDCYLGVGFKDRDWVLADAGWYPRRSDNNYGIIVSRNGMEIHSADPSKARLVIRHHGREGCSEKPAPPKNKYPKEHAAYISIPRKISILFLGGAKVDGLVFDDFHKDGILLAEPGVRTGWKHVGFGKGNDGPQEQLFAEWKPHEKQRAEIDRKFGDEAASRRDWGKGY
jgi:hypothetical protein